MTRVVSEDLEKRTRTGYARRRARALRAECRRLLDGYIDVLPTGDVQDLRRMANRDPKLPRPRRGALLRVPSPLSRR